MLLHANDSLFVLLQELRQQQQEELGVGEKGEAEMDLSDEEDQIGTQSGTQSEAKRPRTESITSGIYLPVFLKYQLFFT